MIKATGDPTTAPREEAGPGRLLHLDGLRGLAAVLVMIQHSVTIIARHPEAPSWYRSLANACNTLYFSPGRAGVVAFFLISGFVIPFSLKAPQALQTFAVSRFFRLYPAYWLSLALAVVLLPALGIRAFPTRQVLANVTMIQFALGQPNVIGAYWTLFIEIAFYFLCATWFIVGGLHSARFVSVATIFLVGIALAAALVRYHHPDAALPVGYVNFLAAMHVGTLTRLATLEGSACARRLLPYVVSIVLLSSIGISWLAYSKTPDVDPWISGITGAYVGYALFFFCIRNQYFTSKPMLFLGMISYSYYLMHGLMLNIGNSLARDLTWHYGIFVIILFVAGLAPLIATASYRLLELPATRIGHQITRRIRSCPPSAGSAHTQPSL